MPIIRAIQNAQQIADELASQPNQHELGNQLKSELNTILDHFRSINDSVDNSTADTLQSQRAPKSGCYQFEGDQAYYCPNCYEQDNSRIATQRLNSKLRVCPRCRSSIKPSH